MSDAARRRKLKAARQKRWHRNQRHGIGIAPVPVNDEVTAALIGVGWVLETESEDLRQVGCGIGKLLEDFARDWHRKNT